MITINKVLCPIDFSNCCKNALENAIIIAEQFNAELHLFHAVLLFEDETYFTDERFPDVNESYNILLEISNKKLSKLIKVDEKKLTIKKVCKRGFSASDEILSYFNEQNIDLIVMGTHGKDAIRHFLLGSVAEKVVRIAPCPVLTIREKAELIGTHNHILVPIDFSDYSKYALRFALELASKYNARITLLHVIEQQIHPAFYATGRSSIFEIDSQLKERSITAMMEFHGEKDYPTIKTEYEVVEGKASHEIIEYANHNNFDLLVIATHGLTGLEHFLMGSTTEKVVRRVNVPVLAIKSPKIK